MITYVSSGARQYGRPATNIRPRADWEFQAVIRGSIGPALAGQTPLERSATLWVFPPGLAHDGVGRGDIVVAPATAVPALLRSVAEELAARGRCIAVALSGADRRRIRTLIVGLRREVRRPDALSALRHELAIGELSVLALAGLPAEQLPAYQPAPQRVVDLALAWCREHLADGASIAGAAQAAGVSPAHLRRLFHDVLRQSPRDVLRDLRVRRAEELLRERGLRLHEIAPRCGFADGQSLARAFRAVRGRALRRSH